ncbi:MAG: hypothetical protein Kow0045_23700 [Albidovulum sp.]
MQAIALIAHQRLAGDLQKNALVGDFRPLRLRHDMPRLPLFSFRRKMAEFTGGFNRARGKFRARRRGSGRQA